jgi:hypothetical protein
MTTGVHLPGLAGRVAAVLLVLGSCVGANAVEPGAAEPGTLAFAERLPAPPAPAPDGPSLVDTGGLPLRDDHAEVVRAVHRALTAGDLPALHDLYAGDDWAGQADLLASEQVRRSVLDALAANPANLSEGYVYPGFAADSVVPYVEPYAGPYAGYRTAFFLDYETAEGPLLWRGIAAPAPALIG